ncbi:sugar phosphate isomerase/epimerase family protein [Nevskia soli]|jgi:hexulose-6-phosphate isomerase|uniref:sugar phosphate isomerase/epimerase family protein n=1 Tax=Nevskia soli TaxID=418856 RepID=UPI0015D76E34|nr:sugar phosphate isomerase/epimerase family protein [Nevskia soli]
MKKSIGDSLIPQSLSLELGLELIRNAGFDGVELWLGAKPWFQMTTTDAELRVLAARVRDAGLSVSNVSNTLDWNENVSARDPRLREAAVRHIERQLEAARIFQTDAILIVAGVVTSENPYNEVYARTVDAMQQLAPKAAAAKVRIGVENCCSEQRFLLSAREFALFLDDVNSPWVGIHLDVGNIHDTGFAEQWIEIHGPRITRIHLKDVLRHRGRCGQESVYTNIFLGDNDWKAIRGALKKVNYDSWLIAEMERTYKFAPDQQFYDTSAAMSRLIENRL